MIEVTGYFSAPIRGEKGNYATRAEIRKNIKAGKEMAAKVKACFGSLLNLYVPHDQDDLIQILWFDGKVTATDILDGDCKIVAKRDILIVWTPKGVMGGGMKREIEEAKKRKKLICMFKRLDKRTVFEILRDIIHIFQVRYGFDPVNDPVSFLSATSSSGDCQESRGGGSCETSDAGS